jgi:hypothetical protein
MSFFETLKKRLITYVDKITRDPEAEAAERKRLKDLKEAHSKATKIIAAEKNLLQKAQNTQSTGRPEEVMRYSIFPEDAKEWKTFLDEATISIDAAENGEYIDEYMKDHFNDDYENYKINYIFNTSVYPRAKGSRVGLWLVIRALKQLMHDNEDLPVAQINLIKTLQADCKKILDDTKYKKIEDWNPIMVEDLKKLDNYKKLFQTPAYKIDKNSEEYKNIQSLAPKIYPVVMKLLKNHGEVDFEDKEGESFTGNVTESALKEKELKQEKQNDNFELGTLILKTISYTLSVLFFLLMLFILTLGSSFAVNLNVHKPLPYKIFYMIYGFLFGLIVVPYTLLYRWLYLKKKPEYYGFIPLIPRFFVNPYVQFLLGWLTYKPLDSINKLEEWKEAPIV